MSVDIKLKELGIEIPQVPKPVAEYISAKKVNNLIISSGQGPVKDGKVIYRGKVGKDITLKEGFEAAKLCALNCLAAIKLITGSLDEIEEIIKVRGFVNSAPDFEKQPKVIDGASKLLIEIFGDKGKHARTALGTSNLPDNIAVELEMVVKVK